MEECLGSLDKEEINKVFCENNLLHLVVSNEENVEKLLKTFIYKLDTGSFLAKNSEGKTALHVAVEKCSTKVCQKLLYHNSEVIKEKDNTGNTPLHLMVKNNLQELFHKALQYASEEDINIRNNHGLTVVHFVADYNKPEIMEQIIKKGADVKVKCKKGSTPLHLAAQRGSLLCTQMMLENISSSDERTVYVNEKNEQGCTAFTLAAKGAFQRMCEILVSEGAEVHTVDNDGSSALHLAMKQRNQNFVCYLVETVKISQETKNGEGLTPLTLAIKNRNEQCFSYLLENRKIEAGEDAHSLVKEAAKSMKFLRLLTSRDECHKHIREWRDGDNNSLLHIALASNAFETANRLIEIDVKYDVKNSSGDFALHNLAKNKKIASLDPSFKNFEQLKILTQRSKYYVDFSNKQGKTPLHLSVESGNSKLLQTMLKDTSLYFQKDNNKNTPFDIAINKNQHDCLKILIDIIKQPTQNEEYIQLHPDLLHQAAKSGEVECCRILMQRPAVSLN